LCHLLLIFWLTYWKDVRIPSNWLVMWSLVLEGRAHFLLTDLLSLSITLLCKHWFVLILVFLYKCRVIVAYWLSYFKNAIVQHSKNVKVLQEQLLIIIHMIRTRYFYFLGICSCFPNNIHIYSRYSLYEMNLFVYKFFGHISNILSLI